MFQTALGSRFPISGAGVSTPHNLKVRDCKLGQLESTRLQTRPNVVQQKESVAWVWCDGLTGSPLATHVVVRVTHHTYLSMTFRSIASAATVRSLVARAGFRILRVRPPRRSDHTIRAIGSIPDPMTHFRKRHPRRNERLSEQCPGCQCLPETE